MTTYFRQPISEPLKKIWETVPGLKGILGTVDHKEIGKRYLVTAFFFFCAAGIMALIMRLQLTVPENTLITADAYNQLFSVHGTTMVFFYITPMLNGFGNFLLPLLIGARDMAFPRLNAFSYWIYLASGTLFFSSWLFEAPQGGWFNYVPLTSRQYMPGPGIDFYSAALIFLGISTTVGGINFIVTTFKLRAPGMSVNRIPLYAWNIMTVGFMMVFALPALTMACALLLLDRKVGTHFYDVAGGGNPLLWQHLFWIFGHPDVYIILVPALGIISEVIPTFSRRPIVSYTAIVVATITIAILSFGVWVHHMFATGLSTLSLSFFSAASVAITLPSGIQVFAWIMTVWLGKAVLKPAMLFALGFIVTFTMGGVTGVMVAAAPFDWQVTDTYFIVAHFHYVMAGGAAMFPVFAGLHYWLPKITGKMLNERLGQLSFWLMLIGFNLTFFPMHIMGLMGMTRRVYTYMPGLNLEPMNVISTVGAFMLGLSVLVFMYDFIQSQRRGPWAGNNPWGGSTLEWLTESPPPPYNFSTIPVVHSRHPLWEQHQAYDVQEPDWTDVDEIRTAEAIREKYGMERQTLGTTILDARVQERVRIPEDSLAPFLVALGVLAIFISIIINSVVLAVFGVFWCIASITGWLWPTKDEREDIKQVRQRLIRQRREEALLRREGRAEQADPAPRPGVVASAPSGGEVPDAKDIS